MKVALILFSLSLSVSANTVLFADRSNINDTVLTQTINTSGQDTTKLMFIPNTGKWNANVQVYSDLEYNCLLTQYSGWNGGDGCYSILLPDGRILWTFQDSFWGSVKANRARVDNVFIHNAALIQSDPSKSELILLNDMKDLKAQTWIKYDTTAEDKDWYWPAGGIINQDKYIKFLGHTCRTGTGAWDFKNISTDIAVFSLPDFHLLQIIRNKTTGDICYGSGICEATDGFVYLYGTTGINLNVARVAKQDVTGTWQYYTKKGWANQADGYSIAKDISPQPNVFQEGGRFYLVSQQILGQNIYIYESDLPTGPWENQRILYRIPEKYDGSSIITYNACFHPSLSRQGELVISYNVNPVNFWDNFNAPGSADKYRPYFIRVFNWK